VLTPELNLVFGPALVMANYVVDNLISRREALVPEATQHARDILLFPLPGLKQAILQPVMKGSVPNRVDFRLVHQPGSGFGRVGAVNWPILTYQVAVGRSVTRCARDRGNPGKGIKTLHVGLKGIVLNSSEPVESKAVDPILLQPKSNDILHVTHCERRGVLPVQTAPGVGVAVVMMMEEGVQIFKHLPLWPKERRINLIIGLLGPGMVEDHIEDDCDAAAMCTVNQRFQAIRGAVNPLRRHVEDRIVTP